WNTGDLVSVFYKSDANDCYRFAGNTGERTSELVRTAKGEKSRSGDHIITVYPYSEDYIISLSAGTIEAHLPAEQTYVNESFGIGSSPMVSMSDYKQVVLKNVCGWLKVQFTGNGEVVDKITLRGNCGEQVAGDIMIVAEDASTILASAGMDIDDTEVGGTLVDEDSIITEVSLICPDGVTLGSEPTSFYIALPPQTFSKGLTVTLYSDKSGAMKQTTDKSITISRNIVQPLASVEANLQPNKIYYTSTDGKIVTPYRTTAFGGANIVSNTYEDNQGVIIFDAPVTEIGSSAFRNRNNLTSVTIPNSVTKIGDEAFYGCHSLTSVTIPNSVTSIGWGAFGYCRSLTSVTIPDSVTTLGDNPFRSCSKLTEFNGKFASADKRCLIVDGVLNSFAIGCGLTEYTIPDSVTEIGDYAFRYCSSLTSVTIPDSVTTIGDSAFEDCSSLTNVTIPDSVTKIGSSAFEYCSSLASVTIPDSVTEIGTWAFNGCSNLTSVTIPDSVTEIRDYAFAFCSSLKSVYLASTTPPTLGVRVFQYNNNGEYKNLDCTIYVRSVALDKYKNAENWSGYNIAANSNELLYTSTDGNIVTPYKATAFGGANIISNTYENGQGIITFDAPVTEIGGYAFMGCSSLTSVTIPDSVTTIGYYAFNSCSSLTSVTIPDSVTTIGYYAFSECSSLTSGTIPDSVTTLGGNPFRSCSKLTEFNGKFASADKRCLIVDGVLNSFAIGCGLTEYAIPNSVTEIESSAFYGCSSLTSVTIPDSVTTIGYSAFYDCSSLTSVTIPDSVTEIGGSAFYNCSSLTSVTIPDSVTTLGTNPFAGCSKLTEFNGKFASADKRCLIVDGVLN
ncbi:MAG: leucine-rich repeat domain-containing protein, partial [Alistipes sp.]|nr:leucine-rich repeat domain-containing protein [Alistipes sp.]